MIKLAGIQFEPKHEDIYDNITDGIKLVEEAAKNGANLISLPEMFFNFIPLPLDDKEILRTQSILTSDPALQPFKEIARKYGCFVVVPTLENVDDNFYINVLVYGSNGQQVMHRRKERIRIGESYTYFAWNGRFGEDYFDTPFGRVIVLICYEMWVPKIASYYERFNGDLYLNPASLGSVVFNKMEHSTEEDGRFNKDSYAVALNKHFMLINKVLKFRVDDLPGLVHRSYYVKGTGLIVPHSGNHSFIFYQELPTDSNGKLLDNLDMPRLKSIQ